MEAKVPSSREVAPVVRCGSPPPTAQQATSIRGNPLHVTAPPPPGHRVRASPLTTITRTLPPFPTCRKSDSIHPRPPPRTNRKRFEALVGFLGNQDSSTIHAVRTLNLDRPPNLDLQRNHPRKHPGKPVDNSPLPAETQTISGRETTPGPTAALGCAHRKTLSQSTPDGMSIVIEQCQQPAAGSHQPGNLASELVKRGKIRQAEKLYRDALDCDPSPTSHLAFGRFLAAVCRDKDAIAPLDRAAAEARTTGNRETAAESLNLLSRIHHRVGRIREAARCEQTAIRVELDRAGCLSATTLVNLATTAATSGDHRRAGRLLQAANRHRDGERIGFRSSRPRSLAPQSWSRKSRSKVLSTRHPSRKADTRVPGRSRSAPAAGRRTVPPQAIPRSHRARTESRKVVCQARCSRTAAPVRPPRQRGSRRTRDSTRRHRPQLTRELDLFPSLTPADQHGSFTGIGTPETWSGLQPQPMWPTRSASRLKKAMSVPLIHECAPAFVGEHRRLSFAPESAREDRISRMSSMETPMDAVRGLRTGDRSNRFRVAGGRRKFMESQLPAGSVDVGTLSLADGCVDAA